MQASDGRQTQVVTSQVTSDGGPSQNCGPHTLYGHRGWSTPLFSYTDDPKVCEYHPSPSLQEAVKLAFHGPILFIDILARIVARMSACRSACHRNNFRKSHVSDVSARILANMSVSVSVSWNFSFSDHTVSTAQESPHSVVLKVLRCRRLIA